MKWQKLMSHNQIEF